MNDTISASERPAEAGIPAVAVIARIAACDPVRVAAEFDDDHVSYGRLHALVEGYRSATVSQGLDDKAAVYAAVVHALPALAMIEDSYELAGVVSGLLACIVDADISPSVN